MRTGRPISAGFVLLATAVIALLAAGVLLGVSQRESHRTRRELVLKQRELHRLSRVMPPLTPEVAQAITDELQRAETTLAAMHAALRGGARARELRAATVPTERTDAYFDLAAFKEEMRATAEFSQVACAQDEQFGFAAYRHDGPEEILIPEVFRQRQVLQYLLETLFAAHPDRLVQLRRSVPAGSVVAERVSGSSGEDFFQLPPLRSVAVPERVAATAFQIKFVGETAVLRRWLNQLGRFELPVVVRAVEVAETGAEPVSAPGSKFAGTVLLGPGAAAAAPVVRREPSTFTVTVEYIELLETREGDRA